MIRFNFKLATRNILRNKAYSSIIIGGFAIGFAACILIALFYRTENSVNKSFAEYKNIYRVYDAGKNQANINYDLYPVLSSNFAEVKKACPMEYLAGFEITLKDEQTSENTHIENIISTNNSFFSVFNIKVLEISSSKPFSQADAIILTRKVAKALFGTQNPLGRKVNINNFFSGTVTAIIDEIPANSTFKAELLMNSDNEKFRMSRSCNNNDCYDLTNHFVLLNSNFNVDDFSQKLNAANAQYQFNIDSLAVQNLADIYLSPLTMKDAHFKGNAKLLKIFLAIGILILLLSSFNYLNYSVSVQFAKLKEIGVNKTNGADFKHLIGYTLTEVTLGISISVVLAIGITLLLLPYTETLFGKTLLLNRQNLNFLVPVFLTLAIMVALINSLAPIYLISKFKITEFLSGFKEKRNNKQFGKQAILTFQLVASIALIAVVLTIFKQLHYVKHSDLGFDKEMLVRVNLPYGFRNSESLKQEVEKQPFVTNATLSLGCPGMINSRMGSNTGENSFSVGCINVDASYLKTMRIELLKGRQFHQGDENKVCYINEAAYKQFQWDQLEEKKFNNGREGGYDVIGVVHDFNVQSLHAQIEPLALLYNPDGKFNVLSVRLNKGNISQDLSRIKQIWEKFTSAEPLSFSFYDDQFQAMYSKEEKMAKSITFFSIIAIVLTCMGILGQIFMICLNRIKEIGVRKVNGATISEVMVMLNKDFAKWVAIAFLIATPIAHYAMNKWLENFAYKTTLSWWIFALAGVLALGISLLTASWQSWKAATRNPVESLRYE